MAVPTPPKNLCLKREENLLILSWDRSRLNSLLTDYMYYRVHQAEESFYDVMPYNYKRLKGYNKKMGNTLTISQEDRVEEKIHNFSINTTYYFVVIADSGDFEGESMPSEEVSMYIDFNVSKPG